MRLVFEAGKLSLTPSIDGGVKRVLYFLVLAVRVGFAVDFF